MASGLGGFYQRLVGVEAHQLVGGGRCAPLAATLSTMASYAAEVQRQAREAARLLQDQASCGH